jgi:Peptidase family M23
MKGAKRAAAAGVLLFGAPMALVVLVLGLSLATLDASGQPGSAPSCASAETGGVDGRELDRWMSARVPGAPLLGLGSTFVAEAGRVGLDPRALVAIAAHESRLGTLGSGADRHNPFGLGPDMRFPSWEGSITFAAETLRSGYLDEGRTTLPTIAAKWAPVGAANDPTGLNNNWVQGVGAAYADLGGDPNQPVTVGAACAPVTVLAGGTVPLPMAGSPQVIGTPNASGSTHDPNAWPHNWQSDNAIDFAIPPGTPVAAVCDGTVGSSIGTLDPSPGSRFGGMRLTINCDSGLAWYYAHLTTIDASVSAGSRVSVGQPVGTSGVANGVAHLHIAVNPGDPMALFGLKGAG